MDIITYTALIHSHTHARIQLSFSVRVFQYRYMYYDYLMTSTILVCPAMLIFSTKPQQKFPLFVIFVSDFGINSSYKNKLVKG